MYSDNTHYVHDAVQCPCVELSINKKQVMVHICNFLIYHGDMKRVELYTTNFTSVELDK